jgi:hypothetical protein
MDWMQHVRQSWEMYINFQSGKLKGKSRLEVLGVMGE